MNPGLNIFKRAQRGITDLPGMQIDPSPKEAAGLYDPGPGAPVDPEEQERERDDLVQANEDDAWEKTLQRRRDTAYKTIGVEINGEEVEIPIWDEDMTPEEAEGFARDRLELGLSPFASDMELDAAIEANGARLDAERNAQKLTPELYAKGTSDVLHLAGGSSNLPPGFTQFWPGGGRWEGPSQVAAGSNILGGHPWQYYAIGNPQAPWIGLEGPRGSLGQWVDIPGQDRRGRVIDVKQKGYGGYGILREGKYDRRGNWVGGGGGGGGGIGGGPFEGWSQGDVNAWHSGAGPGQMGYPSFSGNTAGPGGTPLTYNTTSYNVPGYGWVPQAQLANAQASGNLWDYMNPFGGTSRGGAGTGDPTQRAVGTAVGTASNLIIPGIGFVTGPVARWITSLIQKNPGMPVAQIRQAVQEKQKEEFVAQAPGNPLKAAATGGGFDPYGNPTVGRQYYSGDFGRGMGGPATGFGNTQFGQLGTGFGTGTVGNFATAIGFGGPYGGSGGTNLGGRRAAGFLRPYSQEQYNRLGGPEKYASPALGTPTQRPSYQQYLSMWNPSGGQAMAGKQPAMYGHTPKLAQFAEGEEDVMALHRGNFPVSEEELRTLPEWLAKLLRDIPLRPPGGNEREQFRPRSVPVMQGPRGKFYDPSYSREDERIMAAMGTSDVNPGLKYFHQKQLRKKKL